MTAGWKTGRPETAWRKELSWMVERLDLAAAQTSARSQLWGSEEQVAGARRADIISGRSIARVGARWPISSHLAWVSGVSVSGVGLSQ